MKKIGWLLISIVGILLVAGIAGLLPVKIFNVISGSMEPTIPTGSLVMSYELQPSEIIVGDVIMFNPRETSMVMHRVVEITETDLGREFITRGDANNTNDPVPIYPQEIAGKVIFFLPGVGYAVAWIRENLIAFIAFSLAILFGYQAIVNYLAEHKLDKSEKTEKIV